MKKNTQKEVEWIHLSMINTSLIHELFNLEMQKENLFSKTFGFSDKLNKRHYRIFNESEIVILNKIKEQVQYIISEGRFEYIFRSSFIKEFLIPALQKVNYYGEFGRKRSLNYSTITTMYGLKHSPFIKKGVELAMVEFKQFKLP